MQINIDAVLGHMEAQVGKLARENAVLKAQLDVLNAQLDAVRADGADEQATSALQPDSERAVPQA